MAFLDDFVLRSLMNFQRNEKRQLSVHPERFEALPSGAREPEHGSLEGYAAIDPGSTGTRAVIAVAKVDRATGKRSLVEAIRIQDFREDDDRDRRTTRGEWPSKCCPFDGPPFHVGYEADSQVRKKTISIKAIPYFRTRDDDRHPFTKALYDHCRSLPSEIERQQFDDTLDSILFNFLYEISIDPVDTLSLPRPRFILPPSKTQPFLHHGFAQTANLANQVVQRILKKCETTGVRLRSLALCIPQTWSRRETPIQEYLGPIFDRTVAAHAGSLEVTFALEAQCQAQHLISKYPRELSGCDELMVLDFGGHSMGGSHSQLHWGSADGRPRFHAPPGGDFGVRGGYELWEIGIGHCIDRSMAKNPKRYPQNRRHVIKQALLDAFFNTKARIPVNFQNPHRLNADLVDYYNDRKATYTVSITAEQLRHEWQSAFRKPIQLASQNIRRVARTARKLRVLLTGGSANNQNLRDEIKGVCAGLRAQGFDVTCNVVAKELDVVLVPKWSIAEGAACCHATAMDVEEFFDLGAALGLQARTNSSDEGEWAADSGELLFCKQNGREQHYKLDIDIDGTKREFRIIANPFQITPHQRGAVSQAVLVRDSYDVWDLVLEYLPSSGGDPAPIPSGRHTLEVAGMVCNGRDAILVLRLRPVLTPSARRSKRILGKLAMDGTCDWSLLFEVPLTSCGPSNLVELDIDRIRGRFWKLEGDAGSGSPPPAGRREVGVELGTPSPPPTAKRRRFEGEFIAEQDLLDGELDLLDF